MAKQTVAIGDTGQQLVDKLDNNFTELYDHKDAQLTVNEMLIEWTQGKDYEPLSVTRDSENRVTSMTVKWPDGSSGVYTATDYNPTFEVYDGYTITHVDSSKTVTQAAVTRNSDGAIITKPALTVL
jgi:hypothetical protein